MRSMSTALLAGAVICAAGCATGVPSTLTVPDPQHRYQNIDVAMTDAGTVRRCADNMLNASPANLATNVTTRAAGTGSNIVVDVGAILNNVGMFNESVPVTYRCTYRNGIMVHGTWTSGLKGD
jgi:hypothetical protein